MIEMIKKAKKELKLKELEEAVQQSWKENKTYEKTKSRTKDMPKYYFLDGPPYASGAIHLGTAWNKILKDAIVRYLVMKGLNVRRQAGWDCHGLPIEVMVEGKLGIKNKKEIEERGVDIFIEECKKWAYEHIDIMTGQFERLGVWMDWDAPYMTLKDEYIEAAWWTIKKAHEKGLITNDLRVVTWCPRCETALADAELEYKERADPSIYVKFPVQDRENEYILIWTTTPWTLIANLAVMVHPDFEYVRAKTDEGVLIIAKELAPLLKEHLGLEYEVIQTITGAELEGLKYENPLKDNIKIQPGRNAYSVILADFVSLEEGTGCVHCAPGHGPEDFMACIPYGIEPICPVDGQGKFTNEAGKYQGLTTKKDDSVINNDLTQKGAMLKSGTISHRYGHCWRCKTPIIYRATEQWFIAITKLKEKMLEEIEKVEWVPDWAGSARFRDWIENAKDWTISRQRYWGIPLPIWLCENEECQAMEVIGTRSELEDRGIKLKELHKPFVDEIKLKCKCGHEMTRVPDVLDVWFDSGVAAWASLGYPSKTDEYETWYPADFITEGHDQTRGWFYSQLGCGILAFDMVPYKKVLMHGFTLDEKGEKMSKSLGNIVSPEEVIEKYGADVLRFYVLWSNKPWEDLRFNWDEVKVVQKMFNIFWNVYVFSTTYMSLDGFDHRKVGRDIKKHYKIEDRWILSRLNSLIRDVTLAFESLHPHKATRALHDFILEDLSRWYITIIRPRTWIDKEDPKKLSAYAVLHEILTKLGVILSPIAPHITEEIYKNLTDEESVHLERWVSFNEDAIDQKLETDMVVARKLIEAVASAREKKGIKRRWPVSKIIYQPSTKDAWMSAENLSGLIKTQGNALRLEIVERFKDIVTKVRPNLTAIGPQFRGDAGAVIEAINSLNDRKAGEIKEIKKRIKQGYELSIKGKKVKLTENHLIFEEAVPERYSMSQFEFGYVFIDTRRDEEIMSQGYAREVVRRIQEMRKEKDMNIEAFITASIKVDNPGITELLKKQKEYITRETRVKELVISNGSDAVAGGYTRDWRIEGDTFTISIHET